MSALIWHDAVALWGPAPYDALAAHRLPDLHADVGDEVRLLLLILLKIKGHAHERPAIAIAISRIEVEIVLAIAHHAALVVNCECVVVVAHDCAFPIGAPGRCAGRHRPEADGSSACTRRRDAAAADEAFLEVIETAGVEVVDVHAQRTGAHEWIHPGLLVEEDVGAAVNLIRIIATDNTGAGRG